jgi:hypothetical protein
MYFDTKNYLKNTRNHTAKQALKRVKNINISYYTCRCSRKACVLIAYNLGNNNKYLE